MSRRNVGYIPVKNDDGKEDEDWKTDPYKWDPKVKVPWRSIALAVFLVSLGSLCLVIAYLMQTKHMAGSKDQIIGFSVIGGIAFIPGFYELRIAYYTWRGYKDYSWRDIPS